ncbi:MAG: lectin-like protein [Oscillospiraceae bacterium]|jgi:hypothetical protein|nr:lectin-like protein [Oscillospiraceae bacterium]
MADKVVFDPQKLQSGSLVDCQEQQLLELAKKLCRIAAEECGENGFRGGIRPGNIYVAEDGRVKVGKTGKAGENGWTKLELEYMAPEVFWNGEESAAADVYAIALIVYVGLNGGKLPFADETEPNAEKRAHALRRRMSGDSFPMPEGVPDKLLAILKRALAFEPDNRYENSYEMLKALWEYCGDEPEEIKPASKAPELCEEPKPQSEPEKQPESEPKPEPEKQPKPEPKKAPVKNEKPKAAPTPKTQEAPKKAEAEPALPKQMRNIHEKRAAKRSAVTLAVITLLLVGVGLGRSSIRFDATPPAVQTQAPEPTAQPTTPPSAAPTETPEPSKAPAEVQYMLYSEDVSWDEAERRCTELGGHLATIKDAADYEKLCQLLADSNAQYVWIGAYRGDDGQIKWLDGKEHDFYAWAQGEPSMTDSYDGAAENYIMLVKQADGTWLYNDSRPDPMAQYSRFYSGKIAYICQIG